MAHVSKNFAVMTIANVAGAPVAGEPGIRVVVPQDCSKIVVENLDAANAILFQTDPTDASTQKSIPAQLELTIDAKGPGGAPAFYAGEVVGYLLANGGSSGAKLSFTR